MLSPMYDAGNRHYYIDELARLKNGNFIIPVRWLEDVDKNVFADAYEVVFGDQVQCFLDRILPIIDHTIQSAVTVLDSHVVLVRASNLQENLLDLVDANLVLAWDGNMVAIHLELLNLLLTGQAVKSGYPARMPNPDRVLAEGDPLYTSWIDIFGDDVSGNRSKNWNKHWNIYMTHRNLPRKLLQQEFHTHFISTSPVASVPEQFHGIKQALE
jgi:hypothetical protein